MALTQDKIDEAVLIAKSATYRLAYEIALEVKYGGKMGCCICNLRLIKLWANVLSCITIDNEGNIEGCLTEAKIKLLIEKIHSFCSIAAGAKT